MPKKIYATREEYEEAHRKQTKEWHQAHKEKRAETNRRYYQKRKARLVAGKNADSAE